jgi:MFS transporter, DHA2 family, multidrug resistance protein
MMAVGAILFSSIRLIPQLLQTEFSYTAELSGLVLMPAGFVMRLLMPVSGWISNFVQPKYLIAVGLLLVAWGMWYMTSLTPDADFGYFARGRIFQILGLPFLFIPITAVSYANLPPGKTSEASALINVARNLGGSIGVSLATTELARRSQFHQARLTEHLVPSSYSYNAGIRQAAQYFETQGSSTIDSRTQAIGWLGELVHNQASILAYIDVFWSFAAFSVLMIPLAFLLRSVNHQQIQMRR